METSYDETWLIFLLGRPTVEARLALYTTASRQAEDTRVQIRKLQAASVKKGKYEKFSQEIQAVRPRRLCRGPHATHKPLSTVSEANREAHSRC
jgi:ribosome recycling factor